MDININGLKIKYQKTGEGKNIDTFAGITNYLSEFMEVYVIDFPRFWRKWWTKDCMGRR